VRYRGATPTRNYVLQGKLDITGIASNAHIQFAFTDGKRILLWDYDSKGVFDLGWAYTKDKVDTYSFTPGQTLTISWKIVVTDNDLYFYIGDELKLVYTAIPAELTALRLGSEETACKFYDMSCLTLADDAAEFNQQLAAMQSAIQTYGSSTTEARLRV
jgi:hypothetical protein